MLKRLGFLFFILLSGCGFKLRGMADIPPWLDNVSIVVQNAHPSLALLLKDQLQAYGIHITSDPATASYLLLIEQDSNQQQITSISASTTPRQYQLIYTVKYSLLKVKGAPIISSNVVSVTRQLTVNNDRILGSDFEGMVINKEMRREAAMQIINHISRK